MHTTILRVAILASVLIAVTIVWAIGQIPA